MPGLTVSVVIATWNTRDLLADCLDSVRPQVVPGGFETIVVDNASSDGTAELLHARAGELRAITNERNAGFGPANNQGAEAARGHVLLFLNADTRLTAPDTLATLADAALRPGVGIAGPTLLNPDGTLQSSCAAFPTVTRTLLVATGLQRLLPDRARARLAPDLWSHDRPLVTDWLRGAALAVRAEAFREVGGFWTPMYGEDEDLALRLRSRGLRASFEPAARVIHVGNQAGKQRWSDAGRAERVATAEIQILREHYPAPRAAVIRAIAGAGLAGRAAVHALLGHEAKAGVFRSMASVYARSPQPGAR